MPQLLNVTKKLLLAQEKLEMLGEHNQYVLQGLLGLSDTQMSELREHDIILKQKSLGIPGPGARILKSKYQTRAP